MRFFISFLSTVIFGTFLVGSEKMEFHSQANQDEFVCTILYDLLGKQDAGTYLEVGAGEPVYNNNTYVLEKNCGWQGVSIDISEGLMSRWYAARGNSLLSTDAIELDYLSVLEGFPNVIDYLSLDIDGYYDIVLRKVLLSKRKFKVITIEHDFYRFGDIYRSKEREILSAHGYYLLCADVSHNECAFEDWWIHPDFFPFELFQQLKSLNLEGKDCKEVMHNIKTITSN